jgi:alpha-galactosidase
MGWNDWAHYQCAINEQTITSNADALVSSGLAAKSYKTVTIDDCWMASARDSTGHLVADPAKDLWTGTTSTVSSSLTATIPAHGTAVWRLTPGAGCAAAVPTGQITGNGAKCMDVTGSGTADGTPVILYSCSGNSNQRWTQPGDGTFHSLGKCLTASGTPAGSYAVLSSCTGAAVQNWTVKGDGTAANGSSGLCLDVYGGGTADLTKIDTWSCGNHQANQAWALPV